MFFSNLREIHDLSSLSGIFFNSDFFSCQGAHLFALSAFPLEVCWLCGFWKVPVTNLGCPVSSQHSAEKIGSFILNKKYKI